MKGFLSRRFPHKRQNRYTTKVSTMTEVPPPQIPEIVQGELPVKSFLGVTDAVPQDRQNTVQIMDFPPGEEAIQAGAPVRMQESISEEVVHDSLQYNASDLEKGELHQPSEQTPLLSSKGPELLANSSANQIVSLQSDPTPNTQTQCWPIGHGSEDNNNPLDPEQNPPPSSHIPPSASPQVPFNSPLSSFLEQLYQRYPLIITYVLVALCIAGAIYSVVTGKGSAYLWTIIKACACWILGTDAARMLFGPQFCDIEVKA